MSQRLRWAAKHAWRDARASRKRLLLYVGAIVAGVAALVAIRAFSDNLTDSVDAEAKTLLGADLELYRREPFADAALALADSFGDDRLEEIALGTMAYFPRTQDSRLVRLRGVESDYPFYGDLSTSPEGASINWHSQGGALVDATLMLQFGVEIGDRIRVGTVELPVLGGLDRIPGEVPTASLVGPRVLVPLDTLREAGLLGPGSQARYALQFRLDSTPEEVVERVELSRDDLRAERIEVETVQYRRRSVGRALDNLYEFLYLAGFAALLLGGIGVASAMSLHAREKVPAVAALRCLGADRWLPVWSFLIQVAAMALVGSLLGGRRGRRRPARSPPRGRCVPTTSCGLRDLVACSGRRARDRHVGGRAVRGDSPAAVATRHAPPGFAPLHDSSEADDSRPLGGGDRRYARPGTVVRRAVAHG